MIPFFLGYALLIWIPTARFRRQSLGFAIVFAGALGLAAISLAHYQLRHLSPSWYIEGMQILLYPYSALVTVVALYIAVLPRTFEGCCPSCDYSLIGLPISRRHCPECGEDLRPDACPSCKHDLTNTPSSQPRCPGCGFDFRERKRIIYGRPSGAERSNLRASDKTWRAWSASYQTPNKPEQQRHPGQPSDQRPGQGPPLAG